MGVRMNTSVCQIFARRIFHPQVLVNTLVSCLYSRYNIHFTLISQKLLELHQEFFYDLASRGHYQPVHQCGPIRAGHLNLYGPLGIHSGNIDDNYHAELMGCVHWLGNPKHRFSWLDLLCVKLHFQRGVCWWLVI